MRFPISKRNFIFLQRNNGHAALPWKAAAAVLLCTCSRAKCESKPVYLANKHSIRPFICAIGEREIGLLCRMVVIRVSPIYFKKKQSHCRGVHECRCF